MKICRVFTCIQSIIFFGHSTVLAGELVLNFASAKEYRSNIGVFVPLPNDLITNILACYFENFSQLECKKIKHDLKWIAEKEILVCKMDRNLQNLYTLKTLSKYFFILLQKYKMPKYVCFDHRIFDYTNANTREQELVKICFNAWPEYIIDFNFSYKINPKANSSPECLMTRWKGKIKFNPEGFIYPFLRNYLNSKQQVCETIYARPHVNDFSLSHIILIENLIQSISKEHNQEKHFDLFMKIFAKKLPIKGKKTFSYLFSDIRYRKCLGSAIYDTIFPSSLFLQPQSVSILVPNPLNKLALNHILPNIKNLDKLSTDSCIFFVLDQKISSLCKKINKLTRAQDSLKIYTIIKNFIDESKLLTFFLKSIKDQNKNLLLSDISKITILIQIIKAQKLIFAQTLIQTFLYPYRQEDWLIPWLEAQTCNTLNCLYKKEIIKIHGDNGKDIKNCKKKMEHIFNVISIITHQATKLQKNIAETNINPDKNKKATFFLYRLAIEIQDMFYNAVLKTMSKHDHLNKNNISIHERSLFERIILLKTIFTCFDTSNCNSLLLQEYQRCNLQMTQEECAGRLIEMLIKQKLVNDQKKNWKKIFFKTFKKILKPAFYTTLLAISSIVSFILTARFIKDHQQWYIFH